MRYASYHSYVLHVSDACGLLGFTVIGPNYFVAHIQDLPADRDKAGWPNNSLAGGVSKVA